MPLYRYTMHGAAADQQTWSADGVIEVSNYGAFLDVPGLAAQDAFQQLTSGRAIFGRPGVACRGPYRITKLTIEEVTR
jgi:hypothetical protein